MGGTVRRRFFRRGPVEILLAAEALALLVFFRVCLVVVPVYWIIRTITRGPAVELPDDEAPEQDDARHPAEALTVETARRVRWAVEAVARHLPIAFVCFSADAGRLHHAAAARGVEHDGLRRGAIAREQTDGAHLADGGRQGGAGRRGFRAVHSGGAMGVKNREQGIGNSKHQVRGKSGGGQADLACCRRSPAWAAASASTRWWMVKRASSRRSLTPVLS